MSKLTLNDDGTITLPLLVPQDTPEDTPGIVTEVHLREPSLGELALCMTYVNDADAALPRPTPLGTDATPEQIETATAELRARGLALYAEDAPYAQAIIKIVHLLSGQTVTVAQLPAWCANPRTCRDVLEHFQTPLVG